MPSSISPTSDNHVTCHPTLSISALITVVSRRGLTNSGKTLNTNVEKRAKLMLEGEKGRLKQKHKGFTGGSLTQRRRCQM